MPGQGVWGQVYVIHYELEDQPSSLGNDLSIVSPAWLGQGLARQLGVSAVLYRLEEAEILDRDNSSDRLLPAAENDAFASTRAHQGAGKAGRFVGGDLLSFSAASQLGPYPHRLAPRGGITGL